MMRRYVMRSKMYSDDWREFSNLDEVRRYVLNFYPAKVQEVYVLSANGKQYGNVLFNSNGMTFWFTPSVTRIINKDGSLGVVVAKYDTKKKEWHPFGL